jgi:hypothetical protein
MNIRITLTGTTPLLMHNPRMVDPDCEYNRLIKEISGKRKKTDEDHRQIEKLEWYGGLYESGGVIVQPTSKVRKCIINTGKITKLGTAVTRALILSDLYVPLGYSGPENIDEVFTDKKFHSRLSVGIGKKRVMRVRPQFLPWSLSVSGMFVEDAGLNFDELVRLVEMAGVVEGIGDNRINGYGRFIGKVVEV